MFPLLFWLVVPISLYIGFSSHIESGGITCFLMFPVLFYICFVMGQNNFACDWIDNNEDCINKKLEKDNMKLVYAGPFHETSPCETNWSIIPLKENEDNFRGLSPRKTKKLVKKYLKGKLDRNQILENFPKKEKHEHHCEICK